MSVNHIANLISSMSYACSHLPELAINLFIIVYLYHMWAWDLPENFVENIFLRPMKNFVIWLGLYHCWKMFGPDPATADRSLRVEFNLVDGSKEIWNFPQLDQMGLRESFLRVREGKLEEWLLDEMWEREAPYFQIHPGYVEYLLREPAWADKQIRSVTLLRVIQFLPSPWEGETVPADSVQVMHEYIVPPERNEAIAAKTTSIASEAVPTMVSASAAPSTLEDPAAESGSIADSSIIAPNIARDPVAESGSIADSSIVAPNTAEVPPGAEPASSTDSSMLAPNTEVPGAEPASSADSSMLAPNTEDPGAESASADSSIVPASATDPIRPVDAENAADPPVTE